jgi:hypothetical protein
VSFILIPVNAWNWRPTRKFLRPENLIDDAAHERMGIYGTMTAEPKVLAEFGTGTLIDARELFSATYGWLVMFKEFCESSGGFRVGKDRSSCCRGGSSDRCGSVHSFTLLLFHSFTLG